MTDANMQFKITKPIIKVVGIGGGGTNAINRMIELGIDGVDFIAANTDAQALSRSLAKTIIHLGPDLTKGLGAGGDPEIGKKAATESEDEIYSALEDADMVFLTAGMGGGTGTGAISVFGEIAKSIGALTIAVVTMPFSFETTRRMNFAKQGIKSLRPHSNTLISIPNDRLLQIASPDIPLEVAFRMADDVLRQAVQGIAEMVTQTGMINIDYSHIRSMMKLGGGSIMAIGHGEGKDKAKEAINQALNHPLLDSIPIHDATGIIANFTASDELSLNDISEALNYLQNHTDPNAEIVMGFINDPKMGERVQVTLVVTGLVGKSLMEIMNAPDRNRVLEKDPQDETIKNDFTYIQRRALRRRASDIQNDFNYIEEFSKKQLMNDLDTPAYMRKKLRSNGDAVQFSGD